MDGETNVGVLTLTDLTLPAVDRNEVWRYAGWHGVPDATETVLHQTMDEVIQAAVPLVTPRVCYLTLKDVHAVPGIADAPDLAHCLESCSSFVLFAATVGGGIDRLMQTWLQTKPTAALLLQALGAERVEALCDVFSVRMKEKYHADTAPRFSPGYGKWALENQTEIVRLLDCYRQIGISLNASLLLSPTKSVTAVLGIKTT